MGMPNIINPSERAEMLRSLYSVTGNQLDSYSTEQNKLDSHSGKGSLPVCAPVIGRVINCSDDGCACHSTASRITPMHDECNYVSTRSGVHVLVHAPSHT